MKRLSPTMKLFIIERLKAGDSVPRIAAKVNCSESTVKYYQRQHTALANRRQKYTPDMVRALIAAHDAGELKGFLEVSKIPANQVSRLIKAHEASKTLAADLKSWGWFSPTSTRECYAVGLSRNAVAESILYLRTLHMTIKVWRGVQYLFYRNGSYVLRFVLSFEDQVGLLGDPKGWLYRHAQRLKDGWQVIRKPAKRPRRMRDAEN